MLRHALLGLVLLLPLAATEGELCNRFLMICAGYQSSAKHNRHPSPKVVYSSFSMKIVLNCVHIWSVDLLSVRCWKKFYQTAVL